MVLRRTAAVAVFAAAVAGCGTAATQPSPSLSPSPGFPTKGVTTAPVSLAQNLPLTDDVRAALVAAAAATRHLKSSDFVGLRPGESYYAYDPATQTYWAAGGLVPVAGDTNAEVSTQDDGSYILFHRQGSTGWQANDVGMSGIPNGAPCDLAPPTEILTLWGWPPHSCRPGLK